MLPVGFKPTILAGERMQTYALDRAATGTPELAGPSSVPRFGSLPTVRVTTASKLLLEYGSGQFRTENRLIDGTENSFRFNCSLTVLRHTGCGIMHM